MFGRWYCDLRFKKEERDRDYGVLGINFLENYMTVHDVTRNLNCFKPISLDIPFIDAKGKSLIGFGEIRKEDKNQDGLPDYVSEKLIPSVAVGLSLLGFILKFIQVYKTENRK